MHQFKGNELDDQSLTCPNCGWKGKGFDTVIIDFYGLSKVKEVHCPKCDEKLGEVQISNGIKGESDDQISNQLG